MWLTPLPQHAQGKLVYYSEQWLFESVAEFRGYDLSPYHERCGIAAMSPADLGRIAWVRVDGQPWYGPCLVVDVADRAHFARAVYYIGEVAEVSGRVRELFGFRSGADGYVWIGACPPALDALPPAETYFPPLEIDTLEPERQYSMWPYPPQELPTGCW